MKGGREKKEGREGGRKRGRKDGRTEGRKGKRRKRSKGKKRKASKPGILSMVQHTRCTQRSCECVTRS
jgi:hypothetical protein